MSITTTTTNEPMYHVFCLLIEATQLQRKALAIGLSNDPVRYEELGRQADKYLQQADEIIHDQTLLQLCCVWSPVLAAYALAPLVGYEQEEVGADV